MEKSSPSTVQRFFHHYPEGHRLYVCIVDHRRFAFDFTDNTFKPGGRLAKIRDACIFAIGTPDERADHGCSYSIEFDLNRLLEGTNPETIPADGTVVKAHWLQQNGDEPDVKVDKRLAHFGFKNVAGRFEPANEWDQRRLDENRALEERAQSEKQYRDFVEREYDGIGARRERLADSVRKGEVGGVLRVLAEDICYWAGNLKQHLLHQVSHLAKDPFFVRMRMVPEDAPFQVYETWAVREWIGSHEAYDLLEFHKSADFARSFSTRVDRLHEARVEFSRNVVDYTVKTRGEHAEGIFVLDEARKELKHQALCLAEYLDVIALQFEASSPAKSFSPRRDNVSGDETRRNEQHHRPNCTRQNGTTLLEQFAAALAKYTGLLNQIVLEAYHPEIESFEDVINWTTRRQAELRQTRENVDRLAGKELVAEVVAPDENSSEQWVVQLLSMVAEVHDAISYVFTSGPPQATSDDPRAKMAANIVSQRLEIVSNLIREMDSRRRFLEAACQVRRTVGFADSSNVIQSSIESGRPSTQELPPLFETDSRQPSSVDPRANANEHRQSLVIDESTFSITWQGKGPVQIGSRREFRLLALLAASKGSFVSHVDLLHGLGSDDRDKIAHTKSRLVKLLKENELNDLADSIEVERGYYGLFIS